MSSETHTPWQSVAQDREHWHALEASFVPWVMLATPVQVEDIPRGKDMPRDGAELEGEWTWCAGVPLQEALVRNLNFVRI